MKHINVFHRIAAVLLCLCMLLPLSACGETKMYQKQVFAMDTVMTLTAYGNKGEAGLNAAQSVLAAIFRLENDTSGQFFDKAALPRNSEFFRKIRMDMRNDF